MLRCCNILIHMSRAGSGDQRPELLQVRVPPPTRENPGSHWKEITEPSVKLVLVFSGRPFSGGSGRTQETVCVHEHKNKHPCDDHMTIDVVLTWFSPADNVPRVPVPLSTG